MSIGVQTGPLIGAQKGPPVRMGKLEATRFLALRAAQGGVARPEARAAQSIFYLRAAGADQLRFLKRQLSLPVSMMSQ